jgi:hypothetical protein
MKLNNHYYLTKNSGVSYLADVENGDVFLINNVVETIFEICEHYDTPKSLASAVFEYYKDTEGDCSLCELINYIEQMVKDGFLLN